MKSYTNKNSRKKFSLILIVVLLFAAVGVGAYALSRDGSKEQQSTANAVENTQNQSMFAFSGAESWRKGPSNNTSIALFNEDESCFVSLEYRAGETATSPQDVYDTLEADGYSVSPATIKSVNSTTSGGDKQYELYQYEVNSPESATKVYGGQELGYLELPNGHVKIIGNCNTTEQLAGTIIAIESVTINL